MVAPHQTFNPVDCSLFDELQLTPGAKAAVDFSTAVSCPLPAGTLTFWTPRTRRMAARQTQDWSRGVPCCLVRATKQCQRYHQPLDHGNSR